MIFVRVGELLRTMVDHRTSLFFTFPEQFGILFAGQQVLKTATHTVKHP